MSSIYLDHNATTPLLPEVADAMAECQRTAFANPESQHQLGRRARRVLEDAREGIAMTLGADLAGPTPDRLIFTSAVEPKRTISRSWDLPALPKTMRPMLARVPWHRTRSAIDLAKS